MRVSSITAATLLVVPLASAHIAPRHHQGIHERQLLGGIIDDIFGISSSVSVEFGSALTAVHKANRSYPCDTFLVDTTNRHASFVVHNVSVYHAAIVVTATILLHQQHSCLELNPSTFVFLDTEPLNRAQFDGGTSPFVDIDLIF